MDKAKKPQWVGGPRSYVKSLWMIVVEIELNPQKQTNLGVDDTLRASGLCPSHHI